MTFNTFVNYAPGTTFGGLIYKGNSLYLPDGNTTPYTTSQPYGFDTMSVLYQNFCVSGSICSITAENLTDNTSLQVTMVPSTVASTYSSMATALSDPKALPLRTCSAETAGGNHIVRFKQYMRTCASEGLRDIDIMTNTNYYGTGTTDPSSIWYWFIYFNSTGSATISTKVNIEITYYVRWSLRYNSTLGA